MICKAEFNPICDIQPVDQFGYVDLGKAFIDGVVPEVSGIIEEKFNNIDDPKSILGRPMNMFDGIEMQASITSYVPAASDSGDSE